MRVKTVPLGEICSIIGGGTPDRGEPSYWGGVIPWASVKDMTDLSLDRTVETITPEGVANSATNLIPKGQIIVPTRMALGKAAINAIPLAINQDLKALKPKVGWDTHFLLWFLLSKASYLEGRGKGATVKGITLDILRDLPVPSLDIDEQRRIAAILDKADAIRRKRQQALALADDFLHSAFLEMFGDPVTNPKGWECAPIESCISTVDAGWSAKGLDRPACSDETGVLKISAVTSGRYRPDENKAVEVIQTGRLLVTPQKGDLLFSRANTRELVAATCIVDRTIDNVFLPDKIWRIRLRSQILTAEYLKFVFSNVGFRAIICSKATGTSGSMLNISQSKLLETSVQIPPIDQQQEFSRLFWCVEETRAQLVAQLENDRALFTSLSQRAFRGEL